MSRVFAAIGLPSFCLQLGAASPGAELILPQGRTAFYADEAIELAVAGLDRVRATCGNLYLGNAFGFGLIGPDGLPARDPRGRSGGLNVFDQAVAADLPTVLSMYWTGYVTHKPWGTRKVWAEPTMGATMRMFNRHTAQRLRRYRRNIVSVGTIDEPGLGRGKTPAGTSENRDSVMALPPSTVKVGQIPLPGLPLVVKSRIA
jgi:hypothetical protein